MDTKFPGTNIQEHFSFQELTLDIIVIADYAAIVLNFGTSLFVQDAIHTGFPILSGTQIYTGYNGTQVHALDFQEAETSFHAVCLLRENSFGSHPGNGRFEPPLPETLPNVVLVQQGLR